MPKINAKPIIWNVYLALYMAGAIINLKGDYEDVWFLVGTACRAAIIIGMIGYIYKIKILSKLTWKLLFILLIFCFSFIMIIALFFNMTLLVFLLLSLPALYALYSYAYRSEYIWKK